MLEISQWRFKLQAAGVNLDKSRHAYIYIYHVRLSFALSCYESDSSDLRAPVVADAYFAQMTAEDTRLRTSKNELESAIAQGSDLSGATAALVQVNEAYKTASTQVRRNCAPPKPKAKGKAKA